MNARRQEARNSEQRVKVFISYSRKDLAFAGRLAAALDGRGFEPLIDREEIYAFEDWWKRIEALIGRADTVIFVLSPDAATSEVALKEVAHAASLNKRFAPIVCRRVPDAAVPEALRRLNFVFFDDPEQFEQNADRLAEALRTDIGWIRQHTRFGEEARQWLAAGRPSGMLLRAPTLEDAEGWIASRPQGAPLPTDETRDFIALSRTVETRRRKTLIAGLCIGLIVAFGLAGYAFEQKRVAEQQTEAANRNLVASKLAESNFQLARDDVEAALAAGLEAVRVESSYQPNPDVRTSTGTLRQVIAANRLVLHMHRQASLVPHWPFEFLDKNTLAYTTESQGLFVVDLAERRISWHLDLPDLEKPEFLQVSEELEAIVVGADRKLLIIDSNRHEISDKLPFPTPIRALCLSPKGDQAAVALDRSLVLFPLNDPDEKKTVEVTDIGSDQRIARLSFDRSGNRLYVITADDYDDHVSILEYDLSNERFVPASAADAAAIASSDLGPFLGRDRVVAYSSPLKQKFGLYDASSGELSDLRKQIEDAARLTGISTLFPVSLNYAPAQDFGASTPLFSITRSFVRGSEAGTLWIHLVSEGRTLLNPKGVKYRLQKEARLFGCRISDADGYLACYFSDPAARDRAPRSREWLSVWSLASDVAVPSAPDEIVRAARTALARMTQYDRPDAPYAAAARDQTTSPSN